MTNQPQTNRAEKKVSEREDQKTKEMMEDLFRDLDAPEPAAAPRLPPASLAGTQRRFDVEQLTASIVTRTAADPELDLEAELEELEEQELQNQYKNVGAGVLAQPQPQQGMDEETPRRAPVQTSAQKSSQRSAPGVYSAKDMDAFVRGLYSKQRGKNIDFFRKDNGETGSENEPKLFLDKETGFARFYYADMHDNFKQKSKVHMYGKVRLEDGRHMSACLTVENVERCIWVFKRPRADVVGLF